MIQTRVIDESATAIPVEVLDALGIRAGDLIGFEIAGGTVFLKKLTLGDPFENPLATFTEWADEIDREAFRDL